MFMRRFIKLNLSSTIINLVILTSMIVGIQNSQEKKKITFLSYESINMPISFIIGASFITGSIFGSFIFSTSKFND